MLAVRGLHHCFGRQRILNGVNLALAAGECGVLLGANGSGKSTLLALLSTRLRLQQGVYQLAGLSVADHGEEIRLGKTRNDLFQHAFRACVSDEPVVHDRHARRAPERRWPQCGHRRCHKRGLAAFRWRHLAPDSGRCDASGRRRFVNQFVTHALFREFKRNRRERA